MKKKRRKHSPEFKAKVALEAVKGIKSIAQLATQYDLHPNIITKWRRQLLESASALFADRDADGKSGKEEEALKERLYQEIGKLQVELEWLKKKVGYDS
jgi:transposase-like protein